MIIERKEYLEKLIAWKDKQLIKIVTCKSQYKNVGLGQYKNVGFPTFLYCLFSLHLL